MEKGFKVQIFPNKEQKELMFKSFGCARFAYNWALAKEKENYEKGGKFISDMDLRKEFTQLKKKEEFKWLNEINNNVTKQAIKDLCKAYKKFFKKKLNIQDLRVKRNQRKVSIMMCIE